MSKQMLESFFPAHCIFIFEPWLPKLYEFLYPKNVEELCPEPILNNALELGITVRQPFLAVFALLGIGIGLIGAFRIQKGLTDRMNTNSTEKYTLIQDPDFFWMVAFLFFGLMNITGLFLHCLLTFIEPTGVYAVERPFLWTGDTFTTGVFGSSLWAAGIMESLPTLNFGPSTSIYRFIPFAWACANLLGLGAVAWFFGFRYGFLDFDLLGQRYEFSWSSITGIDDTAILQGTLPLEMWYAAPPAVFGASALVIMLLRKFSWRLCVGFSLSYATLIFGLSLDSFFCRKLEGKYLDLLTAPTLLFLATDIAYLAIAAWLGERDLKKIKKKKVT